MLQEGGSEDQQALLVSTVTQDGEEWLGVDYSTEEDTRRGGTSKQTPVNM